MSVGGGPGYLLDFSGSPFADFDRNSNGAEFTRNLRQLIETTNNNQKISSILVVTAHWEESEFSIDYPSNGKSSLVYDYYGFPKESYAPYLTYPVNIDLPLADRIADMLTNANIKCNKIDRGLDHGTFIPLKVAFPNCDVPVVQLSLKIGLDISEHIRLGEVLSPLKKEGVLIICSGQATHNLSAMRQSPTKASVQKAKDFTDWLCLTMEKTGVAATYQETKQSLIKIATESPHFDYNHPHIEHFAPFCVAFGTIIQDPPQDESNCVQPVRRVYNQLLPSGMSLDSYFFM
eukprot:gene7489-10204_t